MEPPRAQQLKEVIIFQTVDTPYDGNFVGTWVTDVATERAYITPSGGIRENTSQEEQTSTQGYLIWTRYNSAVTIFQQIAWGSKRLVITSVEDWMNEHRWLLIRAEHKTDLAI